MLIMYLVVTVPTTQEEIKCITEPVDALLATINIHGNGSGQR